MNDQEQLLLMLMERIPDTTSRAVLLQGFIQTEGPLSEEAGAKVRALLSEERTSAHEGSGAET